MNRRKKNVLRNSFWGVICKLIQSVCPFIVRTIMISTLGKEYTGLGGLFTSILKILSLAELGFSSAITYNMYGPIARGDKNKIDALINAYRKIYHVVGIIVLIIGIIILPFLDYLIYGNRPKNINIFILYLLYLCNTCLTYFLYAYRTSLLNAYQRYDIVSKISLISSVFMYVLEIWALLSTKNYYIYAFSMICSTVLNNLLILFQTKRLFPDVKCKGTLSVQEKADIKMRVKALLGHRIGTAVITSADNIVISSFLGLSAVTCFNNYYTVLAAMVSIIDAALGGIVAPIGNYIELNSKEDVFRLFRKMNYLLIWVTGWFSICYACLIQDFIKIWLGNSYQYESFLTILLFAFYFYTYKIRSVNVRFKEAAGMWNDDFWKPYIAAGVNVITNILLVNVIGIDGVLLSTIVSMVFINLPWEVHVLYKNLFEKREAEISYYKFLFRKSFVALVAGVITFYVCGLISFETLYLTFIIKLLICVLIPNLIIRSVAKSDADYYEFAESIKRRIIVQRIRKILD